MSIWFGIYNHSRCVEIYETCLCILMTFNNFHYYCNNIITNDKFKTSLLLYNNMFDNKNL